MFCRWLGGGRRYSMCVCVFLLVGSSTFKKKKTPKTISNISVIFLSHR